MAELQNNVAHLVDARHPLYLSGMTDWYKWRLTYLGGDEFREAYLKKFSTREDQDDFNTRKDVTPVPKFAGAAINDIRNAIYQRMRDITRKGGSKGYQYAVSGNKLGVDRRGSTMNAFIGVKVLTELLVMGRVGVFVDAPPVPAGATLADVGDVTPYLYKYDIEDILSWTCSKPDSPSEFQALLLRDTTMQYDQSSLLPTLAVTVNEHGHAVGWPVKKYVMLRANGANASVIMIGNRADNAGDGFILSAGQQSPPLHVDDVNRINIVGGAADQRYSWIAC
jgi:hypothetical protein